MHDGVKHLTLIMSNCKNMYTKKKKRKVRFVFVP